jgi:hypothetical protein
LFISPPSSGPAGRGLVLLGREQQGHVHRHRGVGALLDRGQALWGARDLDEQVVQRGLAGQALGLLDGGLGVVGQQRGHLDEAGKPDRRIRLRRDRAWRLPHAGLQRLPPSWRRLIK